MRFTGVGFPVVLLLAGVTGVAALTGCTPIGTGGGSMPAAVATDAAPADPIGPAPESTVTPEPGSWAEAEIPAGYRVALITGDDSAATAMLAAGVADWAQRNGVELAVLEGMGDDAVAAAVDTTAVRAPDLVIGAGAGVVDMLSFLTPQRLEQRFLVLGAQLAEPTENVTAVIWTGAGFRGTGLGGDVDATGSVTPQRAEDAVSAGVASVLSGRSGIVLDLG